MLVLTSSSVLDSEVSMAKISELNCKIRGGKSVSVSSGPTWQWIDDRFNNWCYYEREVQDFIEAAYQTGYLELNLHERFQNLPYIISFQAMTQTSKNTGFTRSIRRFSAGNVEEDVKMHKSPISHSLSTNDLGVVTRSRSRTARRKDSTNSSNFELRDTESSSETPLSVDPQPTSLANGKHSLHQSHSNDSFRSTNKKTKSGSTPPRETRESMTLLQKLVSPARAIAGLFKTNKPPRRNRCDSRIATTPHPRNCTGRPVKNTKLPEDIRVLNSADLVFKPVAEILQIYTTTVDTVTSEEDCCICCERLSSPSSYDDDKQDNAEADGAIISLKSCSHMFHKACIAAMYISNNQRGFLQCPTCKIIYGVKVGDQPDGKMDYHVVPCSLPGNPECETIVITYYISQGIQGSDHPFPGQRFSARGFPRRCYLPDNEEGRHILRLLIIAWERRLTFTIGTSATTGEDSTVTWNEIHHKTEFGSNYSGHGFPDPMYKQNVIQELGVHGVTAADTTSAL